jgi:Lipopolysaccharide-assembly
VKRREVAVKYGWSKGWVLIILFPWLLMASCGYGFRGTVNNLPPDIQAVYIPVFVNETNEPGAEVTFANALIYEFTRSRVLKVVSESQAQAVVKGKIKSVTVESVVYATTSQALERKVFVTLDVVCQRTDNEKILWQNSSLSRYETIKASDDPTLFENNKQEALRKMAKDLSERIHNGILENF